MSYIPLHHSVQKPKDPILSQTNSQLRVHQVPALRDNLCWLIEYQPGVVAVVDGPSADEVLAYCHQHNLQLTHILNTHIHGDHIGINHQLAKKNMLDQIEVYGYQGTQAQIPGLTHALNDADVFLLGELSVTVWLTEGHINGHVSYIVEDFLFCGDTLFSGGCGYLFDGPAALMHQSLGKLATLPDHTYVCCAHEYTMDNLNYAMSINSEHEFLRSYAHQIILDRADQKSTVPSTIGIEKQINPFLRIDQSQIRTHVREAFQLTVDEFNHYTAEQIFALIRKLKDLKQYKNKSLKERLAEI